MYTYTLVLKFFLDPSSIDANLPVILTKEDQTNMYQIRSSNIGRRQIWLGGAYLHGRFQWDDEKGTSVIHGFENWAHGQPKNFGYRRYQKNCMTMFKRGTWTTEQCDSKFSVICERCLTCQNEYKSTSG